MHASLRSVSLLVAFAAVGPALGREIECRSNHYEYTECYAGFSGVRLKEQLSRSRCTEGKTWGYNAATGDVWVSEGCGAIFRDSRHGYRDDQYDARGHSNYNRRGEYIGPHGLGRLVDDPDHSAANDTYIDPRPQFDENGNPNFDAQGNYIGR